MSTRGAAKQQELEEQFSSILAFMEELKANQHEQAKRHEERQTEILEELRTSTHRHEEQLARLAGDHERRLESLTADQLGTAEAVTALEKNLTSIKSVMQDRLGEAEERLDQLRNWQAKLAEKQDEFRAEVQEELARLEAKTDTAAVTSAAVSSKSSLRLSAPPFVPAATSSSTVEGGSEGDGSGSKSVRPAPYDGKSAWEAYHTQFKMLADLNHWTDHQKATHLAISLRGPALTVLTNLPEEQRGDFTALAAALRNRFGNNHQAELNRAHLRSRMKKREETLPELAEDVERLTRLAYPEAAEAMIVVLAKDQFIDALPDEDMRLRIRQSRPPTLRQALETALELESYSMASKRGRPVREVHLERGSHHKDGGGIGAGAGSDVLQQLEKCVKNLQRCTQRGRRRSSGRRRKSGGEQGAGGRNVCWGCGQPGHFQRDCPKEAASNTQSTGGAAATATTQDQGNDQ